MTNAHDEATTEVLYLAIEVGEGSWKLGLSDLKQQRLVDVPAWAQQAFKTQVAAAKRRFGLAKDARVRSCYEAGRSGFSIHRLLESLGVESLVVDSASIEVSRRGRRRKTDRLDAKKLLAMLIRYHVYGEKTCWQVCHVPNREQEAARRLDREYNRLKKEQTAHVSRIRSLLALHGVRIESVRKLSPGAIRDWSGSLIEPLEQEEIERELERLRLVDRQVRELRGKMRESIHAADTAWGRDAAKLQRLKSIGEIGATALSRQFFSWRDFANVRQVGAAAGLVGCPYNSGSSQVEQGITKAGHRRIRTLAVELAWMWLRHQPDSALSRWYNRRFAKGGKRLRRIGIVALARKLLVALWKWLRFDQLPEGALLSEQA